MAGLVLAGCATGAPRPIDPALVIRSMKRYLALVPDAPDAQAAQDRIYAWEAMAERRSAR